MPHTFYLELRLEIRGCKLVRIRCCDASGEEVGGTSVLDSLLQVEHAPLARLLMHFHQLDDTFRCI